MELCIYVCMYLPQATSRPPSIGSQSDFVISVDRGQESWLDPSLVAFDFVVGHLPALPHILAQRAASTKQDESATGLGLERSQQASELGAGCMNPAY